MGKIILYDDIDVFLKKGAILVDVRTPKEWEDTGVIEGSIKKVSFDEDNKLDMARFERELQEAGVKKDSEILLICRSGIRSGVVARELAKLGYGKTYNVTFGINGWIAHNLPTTKKKRDL